MSPCNTPVQAFVRMELAKAPRLHHVWIKMLFMGAKTSREEQAVWWCDVPSDAGTPRAAALDRCPTRARQLPGPTRGEVPKKRRNASAFESAELLQVFPRRKQPYPSSLLSNNRMFM